MNETGPIHCPRCNRIHGLGSGGCDDPLSFSPERLAQGEADVVAGRVKSLSETIQQLRERITPVEALVDALGVECEWVAYGVAQHRHEKPDCDSPGCLSVHALLAAIRALTERAERLQGERDEARILWTHQKNLTDELSTLTATHAAALEQERERALRWAWEHCKVRGTNSWTADQFMQFGLAALRGKGEGE